MKNKYTIEDLKTKKIAVHLPTQEEWDRAMKIFEVDGLMWSEGQKLTEYDGYEILWAYIVLIGGKMFMKTEGGCKEAGYTIITIDQLIDEPRKEENNHVEQLRQDEITYSKITPFWEHDLPMEEETININEGIKESVTFTAPEGHHFENGEVVKDFKEEDFSIEKALTKKISCPKAFLEGEKEGTRAWAFEMLDKGEKIRHKDWYTKDSYYHIRDSYHGTAYLNKDGWEIYKPEEKEPKE